MGELTQSATDGGVVLEMPFKTLTEALDAAVRTRGDQPALRYFDSSYTFSEVRDIAGALAAHWQDQGILSGDRIMVQLQNVPQFLFAVLAAWELGAIAVPVSPMYRAREIRKIAEDARPVVWVTSPDVWERQGTESVDGSTIRHVLITRHIDFTAELPEVFAGLESASFAPEGESGVQSLLQVVEKNRGRRPLRAVLRPEDCAALTYTSGTTGPPKGALTTHQNLLWVGHAYPAFNGVAGPEHVMIGTAPLVHITGLSMHLVSWLTEACELVLAYRFEAAVHLELMERHRVSWTTGATTVYLAMLRELGHRQRDLSSLRFLGCGGAPVPTEMAARIKKAFGTDLKPGYGLTESTAAVTSTPKEEQAPVDSASGIISVGKALFDIRIRIAGPHGETLPVGARGEVLLAGPGIVSGYWENDEATEAAFVDGWLKTGDVGFIDLEGWLYIVDRTKNMIVASGYKVWPREVEDVLYAHEAVREVAVVGAPDEYRGETVVACISLAEGLDPQSWPELEGRLRAYCKKNLAAYKVPSRFLLKDELPKNFNGKIQHLVLREEAVGQARQEAERA
jgi:long-chain acyl-CoA synthetase